LSPNARGPSAKPDRADRAPLATLPVTFVGSFPDPAVPLDPPLPEIAFVGRSNVGKSSLLNALVGRKGLARVSGTPGKTRLMNVFRLPDCYLVDLPGYGWAKASAADREGFRSLLDGYLTGRAHLVGVVWLLDVRHPPSAEDRVVQDLLVRTGRPCLVVLTKTDKFARSRRLEAVRARAADLGLEPADLLVTSARTGEGIRDLGDSILASFPA
jgi:GTP-binding protein